MKTALAIWFSLALVLTQNVGRVSAAMPGGCAVKEQCCCGTDRSCCKAKPASDAPAAPVVPSTTRPTTQLQLALPLSRFLLCLTARPEIHPACFNSPITPVGAVSIYQRNCAYLI